MRDGNTFCMCWNCLIHRFQDSHFEISERRTSLANLGIFESGDLYETYTMTLRWVMVFPPRLAIAYYISSGTINSIYACEDARPIARVYGIHARLGHNGLELFKSEQERYTSSNGSIARHTPTASKVMRLVLPYALSSE